MRGRTLALLVSPILLMSSSFEVRAGVASNIPKTDARVIRDVEYARAGGVSLRLDASIPDSTTPVPAIIIVHGGGWVMGDRRFNVEPLFAPLTDAGFAWFSISYRLATDVMDFGVAVDDVQSAIRFVKAHAGEYGIDAGRLALVGESAGGQLAAMAALRAQDPAIRGVVALYTPSDLVSLVKSSDYIPRAVRNYVHGTPWEALVLAGLAQLSPIDNVRKQMPPFLLIHGTDDLLVPFSQSVEMCNRMRTAGASCEVFPVEGGGHGIRWWESSPRLRSAYKSRMVDWLEARLGCAKRVPL